MIRLKDDDPALQEKISKADSYIVDYVGIKLGVDGFAIEATRRDKVRRSDQVTRSATKKPLILIAADSAAMAEGAKEAGDKPLLYAADESNWQKMAELAKSLKTPLAVKAASLEKLAELTESIKNSESKIWFSIR